LPKVSRVIFTDYDPGSLEIIKSNVEMNKVEELGVMVAVDFFAWGKDLPVSAREAATFDSIITLKEVESEVKEEGEKDKDENCFTRQLLLVGSDLLYCCGVVEPLLKSVAELLNLATTSHQISTCPPPMFVLVSSFETGEDVASEMKRCLTQFGLQSSLIEPLCLHEDASLSQCKIEYIAQLNN
jgi:hypothetical protein